MHAIRFLHVLIGVSLAGVILANYFYISVSMREKNNELLSFVLKRSLFSDCVFTFPAIVITLITGSYQVLLHHLPPKTPWVISAYLFFLLLVCCWFILFFLKSYNYVKVEEDIPYIFKGKKLYHVLNIVSLLLIIFIIHDAVRKITFIPWQI